MSLKDMIRRHISGWMNMDGPESDVVLSSRVRLARDLKSRKFPNRAGEAENREALAEIEQVALGLIESGSLLLRGARWFRVDQLQPIDRQILVEKHLVSPQFVQEPINRGVLLSADETVSTMANEEDHLRIQTIHAGLRLRDALDLASQIDDMFEASLDYEYSERLGYITSCPTNVGTGMRASVMLHLPALAMTNRLSGVVQAVSRVGMAVRGLYGEGTESVGNILQLSNQVSLGCSEEEISDNLTALTRQLIDQERSTREALARDLRRQLEDRVHRAYGILTNARILSSQEAIGLLSDVKLGIDLGMLGGLDSRVFTELLILTRPAHLQKFIGRDLSPEERDVCRADLVRERFRIDGLKE